MAQQCILSQMYKQYTAGNIQIFKTHIISNCLITFKHNLSNFVHVVSSTFSHSVCKC